MADQRHALVQVAADCGPSIERWENEGGALLDDRRVGGGGGWLREPAGSTGTRSRPATSQVGAATTSRRSRLTRRTDLSPSRAVRSRSHDRNGRSPCPDRRETALGTVARFSPQPASLEVPGWNRVLASLAGRVRPRRSTPERRELALDGAHVLRVFLAGCSYLASFGFRGFGAPVVPEDRAPRRRTVPRGLRGGRCQRRNPSLPARLRREDLPPCARSAG
jgi:hypothetical protein